MGHSETNDGEMGFETLWGEMDDVVYFYTTSKNGKSLRQGNPISLFLFLLVSEVLVFVIKKSQRVNVDKMCKSWQG